MNDGGPAFPSLGEDIQDEATGRLIGVQNYRGMSLRDWFAGMALQGMLSSWPEGVDMKPCTTAIIAYGFADALLGEREKKGE